MDAGGAGNRQPRIRQLRKASALAAVGLLSAGGVAGCGAASSSAATGSTSPTATPPPAAPGASPGQTRPGTPGNEAAECTAALTPWTQYIADTSDFSGWVQTIGKNSPLVLLPQNAAKVYIDEQSTAGAQQASSDGFADLDRECAAFAAHHPGFDFHALPTAPTVTD